MLTPRAEGQHYGTTEGVRGEVGYRDAPHIKTNNGRYLKTESRMRMFLTWFLSVWKSSLITSCKKTNKHISCHVKQL